MENEKTEIEQFVLKSTNSGGTYLSIAKLIHYLYKNKFLYFNNIWFEFINNNWIYMDNAKSLRLLISDNLIPYYQVFSEIYRNKSLNEINSQLAQEYINIHKNIDKIIIKLQNPYIRDIIIKECQELFNVQ